MLLPSLHQEKGPRTSDQSFVPTSVDRQCKLRLPQLWYSLSLVYDSSTTLTMSWEFRTCPPHLVRGLGRKLNPIRRSYEGHDDVGKGTFVTTTSCLLWYKGPCGTLGYLWGIYDQNHGPSRSVYLPWICFLITSHQTNQTKTLVSLTNKVWYRHQTEKTLFYKQNIFFYHYGNIPCSRSCNPTIIQWPCNCTCLRVSTVQTVCFSCTVSHRGWEGPRSRSSPWSPGTKEVKEDI